MNAMLAWVLGALLDATAVPADAGLVTRVAGKVTWKSDAHPAASRVVPLGKLRDGEELSIPAGGSVTVVYFGDGREEWWRGPARARVGVGGGKALAGASPEVRQADELTTRALRRVPTLVRCAATDRVGAATLRGHGAAPELIDEEQQALALAKADYEQRRASAPADDVAVDVAYLVLLRDFDQWHQMQAVLTAARARAPGNATLDALAAWVALRLPRQ